jgi:hypothetical protein
MIFKFYILIITIEYYFSYLYFKVYFKLVFSKIKNIYNIIIDR